MSAKEIGKKTMIMAEKGEEEEGSVICGRLKCNFPG